MFKVVFLFFVIHVRFFDNRSIIAVKGMASFKRGESLADQVASLCYKHFDKLPKKGKPLEGREWTILAAIVKQDTNKQNNFEVISMGTGSKCVGQNKLSSDGDLLNDSHAEIIARRGFLRYMYQEMEDFFTSGKESSVLTLDPNSNEFQTKMGIEFIFFSSWTPCGDASIILKNCTGLDSENELQPSNIQIESSEEPPAKVARLEIPDVHRTGAKCVEGGLQVIYIYYIFISCKIISFMVWV